ncbi:hypothetical protein EC845_1343 [Comamonas sp. BIGb0124]|uniref:hypothetical protein n=1 Tax=Comamonas sp. BIGb0124 TaxID=2485130 RepID=UPI000FBC757D|nr:hypothetical protein [Comamonas sp. BIGb0124]ROR22447.1 hypothetical protein EC845_1343 [Comamonas sp. BIGb0124]
MSEQLDMPDAILEDLHHLKAVLTTLGYAFGGDCPADERPEELQLCLVIQWACKVADRVYRAASEDSATDGFLSAELMEVNALLRLLDSMNVALDMKIAFNDAIMSSYIDALVNCVERALRRVGDEAAI